MGDIVECSMCYIVENTSSTPDTLSAVVSHGGFEQLRTEVEHCYATLGQLNSALLNVPKQFLQQTSLVTSVTYYVMAHY